MSIAFGRFGPTIETSEQTWRNPRSLSGDCLVSQAMRLEPLARELPGAGDGFIEGGQNLTMTGVIVHALDVVEPAAHRYR